MGAPIALMASGPQRIDYGGFLTKEQLARDAAEIFRLLRAFRLIKEPAARRHVVETVEALAEGRPVDKALDDKAEKPHV